MHFSLCEALLITVCLDGAIFVTNAGKKAEKRRSDPDFFKCQKNKEQRQETTQYRFDYAVFLANVSVSSSLRPTSRD